MFGLLLAPLTLLSLQGIYLSQIEQVGGLGLIGFVLAFMGTSLTGGVMFYSYVISSLALKEPSLAQYFGPGMSLGGAVDGLMIASGMAYLMGWVVFGLATFRAQVYPRWMGFLLAFGLLLGLPLRLPMPGGRSVGFAIWSIAFIALGIALWKGDRHG